MARLGDICKFQSGGTPSKGEPSYFNGNIPWITTVALNGSIIDESYAVDWITEKAIEKSAAKVVPANSVMVGTRVGVGKVAINKVPMSTSQDIISLLDIDESKWSKEFVCKFILGKATYLNSQARGATIKGIKIETLAGLQLPDIPLEQQYKLAAAINAVDNLIALRKEQLAKLDQLVKSRFVELFGECKKQTSIKESGLTISDGNYSSKYPRSEEFVESGIPFIRANNLKNGTVVDEDMYFITPKKHAILLKGHLKSNDVLITTRGNIGQVAIVPKKHNDSNINAQIVLLRDENDRFVPQYLLWALQTEEAKSQYIELQTGTALKQLPVGRLEQVIIKEPPIELQEQFATFVEQTDKSKLAILQSLGKLELLKKALMQEYFG